MTLEGFTEAEAVVVGQGAAIDGLVNFDGAIKCLDEAEIFKFTMKGPQRSNLGKRNAGSVEGGRR